MRNLYLLSDFGFKKGNQFDLKSRQICGDEMNEINDCRQYCEKDFLRLNRIR